MIRSFCSTTKSLWPVNVQLKQIDKPGRIELESHLRTGNQSDLLMRYQLGSLESGADMQISNGIGRINLIENLVALTGNPFEMYQEKSMYELALDLKIAKLQVGM